MALYIGANAVDKLAIGDTPIDKLYLGSNELWTSEITPPSWFTPEWYASAKTYLDGAFTYKPSNLYMDLIYDYYPLSGAYRQTKGITRIYWWNNPAPAEPIKIQVDPSYITNNNYWWRAKTATGARDYWYPGSFYQEGNAWTVRTAPNSVQTTDLYFAEYAFYDGYNPKRAPAVFYAGGNVTAEIILP